MMQELTIPAEFGEEVTLTCWRDRDNGNTVARLSIRDQGDDDYWAEVDISATELMPLALALASIATAAERHTAENMNPADLAALVDATTGKETQK